MATEIVLLIVGLVIGFLIAWWIISQQKWADKAKVLNATWEKKLTNLEKEYDVKLEKANTNIEKLSKEWEVKYVKDIEELKKLFKESEKIIKLKSVSSSRRSLVGKFIERFIPFLSKIPFAPSDMHFIGNPIDYIVFQGLKDDKVEKVIFLEVKTGESKLTKREKSLMDTIQKRKVSWQEIRVDTSEGKTPDKEIEKEETSIKELYDMIDDKVKTIRSHAVATLKASEEDSEDESAGANEEESEEYDVVCPKCEEEFTVKLESNENLEDGVKVECPHCEKTVTIHEGDVA